MAGTCSKCAIPATRVEFYTSCRLWGKMRLYFVRTPNDYG